MFTHTHTQLLFEWCVDIDTRNGWMCIWEGKHCETVQSFKILTPSPSYCVELFETRLQYFRILSHSRIATFQWTKITKNHPQYCAVVIECDFHRIFFSIVDLFGMIETCMKLAPIYYYLTDEPILQIGSYNFIVVVVVVEYHKIYLSNKFAIEWWKTLNNWICRIFDDVCLFCLFLFVCVSPYNLNDAEMIAAVFGFLYLNRIIFTMFV